MTGIVTHIDQGGGYLKANGLTSIRFQSDRIHFACRDRIAVGIEVCFAVLSGYGRDAFAVDVEPTGRHLDASGAFVLAPPIASPSNADAERKRTIAKDRDAKTVEKRAAKFGDAPSTAMSDAFARTGR